jgi:uncharacterized membrane protein
MQSKASVKHHPIHPMLVPFPIAFLTGALIFDALGFLTGRPDLWTTATYLAIAGVVAGLVAAVPGLVDYVGSVPPDSSAKARATGGWCWAGTRTATWCSTTTAPTRAARWPTAS